MAEKIAFSVFTKPWKMPIPELGKHVRQLGFDGIELPVRPGYQVLPEKVRRDLPAAARQLADQGVTIHSIAGPTDEATIAACAESGIPIIRICEAIPEGDYLVAEADLQRKYDALVPLLDKHGVTLGIQNHCGRCVCNAMGLLHLIGKYDPRHIGAVWDAAHNALDGEQQDMALDIIWSHLCMVNLKNAFWERATGPEAEYVQWRVYWTSGRQGLASWPAVAKELKRRDYSGTVCLCAEYNDEEAVNRLAAEDLEFAKGLFEQ